MAIVPFSLVYDTTNRKLGKFFPLNDNTNYSDGSGWYGSAAGQPDNYYRTAIGLIDAPPGNFKATQVTITYAITLSQPQRVTYYFAPNSALLGGTEQGATIGSGVYTTPGFIYNTDGFGSPLNLSIQLAASGLATSVLAVLSVTINGIIDDSLDATPIASQAVADNITGCEVDITYTAGTGPACVAEGDIFTVTSGKKLSDNVIQFTFSHPCQISVKSVSSWNEISLTADPWLVVESPLGTTKTELQLEDFTTPAGHLNLQLTTRITIYGPDGVALPKVQFSLDKIYPGDENTVVTDVTSFGAITEGLDGIIDAINKERDLLGAKIADLVSAATGGLSGLPKDIVDSILNGLGGLLNLIPGWLQSATAESISLPQGIINSLVSAGIDIESDFGQKLFDMFMNIISSDIKLYQGALGEYNTDINNITNGYDLVVARLLSGQYLTTDEFYDALKTKGANTQLLELLQNVSGLIGGTFAFIHAKNRIIELRLSRLFDGQYTPALNDIATLYNLFNKGYLDFPSLKTYARKLGYDEPTLTQYILAHSSLPSLGEIRDAFLRGYINESALTIYLNAYGFNAAAQKTIKDVYNILPSPTDITRLADKHIFSSDIATTFGQYTEIDQGYIDSMKKWGIDEDWTRKLWASHWSLPGLQDTFDMFHRGIINQTELNTFFALTDILPFFREKLKLLNYSLITRVDIRRFYAEGIFTEAEVFEAYKKLGFDDANAQKQTNYTVVHERESENPTKVKIKTLTQSLVVKAYKRGIITLQEAIARLGKVGYLPSDAQLIIELETQIDNASIIADKTQQYHDKTLTLILDSYKKGTLSYAEAKGNLTTIGVPNSQADQELAYVTIERTIYLKDFVIDHVRKAYTQGQITQLEATNFLTSSGFVASEVTTLMYELNLVKDLRNKPLTEIQLKDLYNAGLIDGNTLYLEFTNIGYNDNHATLLTNLIVGVV